MLRRLEKEYKVLYTNNNGMCAHEFILDTRVFGPTAHVEAIDIAKRLHVSFMFIPCCPLLNLLLSDLSTGLWVPQSDHVIPCSKHFDD
jgi:hypothetical protein